MSRMKVIYKKTKGITLIALVITIIVLLILAGVSIATLGGENGIIGRARKAKTTTEEKQSEEEAILLVNEYEMYKKMCEVEGKQPNVEEFLEKNYKDKYKFEDGKYKIKTENGKNLEIDDKGNVKLNDEVIKANNVKSITINGEKEVEVGSDITLTVNSNETNAIYNSVKWICNDNSKATINSNKNTCIVTGVSEGTVEITCIVLNYDNTTISNTYDVKINSKSVKNIEITGNTSVEIGNSIELTATISPIDAKYQKIEWSSDNNSIAVASGNGSFCTVTGKSEGTAIITCKITNNNDTVISKEYNISINSKSVKSIEIKGATSVEVGKSISLTATISPTDAKYQKMEWSSSSNSIATVAENGPTCTVTGKSEESVKITCKVTNNNSTVISKEYSINVLNSGIDVSFDGMFSNFHNYTVNSKSAGNLTVSMNMESGCEDLNVPIYNLEVGSNYTLSYNYYTNGTKWSSYGNYYGVSIAEQALGSWNGFGVQYTWAQNTNTSKAYSHTFKATKSTMYICFEFAGLDDGYTCTMYFSNVKLKKN